MAVKIFSILMLFLSLALVLVSMQDFYLIEMKPYNINFKNVEAKEIDIYELNTSQVKTHYSSSQWFRYEDKDTFNNFLILGFDYNLSSNQMALLKGNVLLSGKVLYEDINQTKIEAEELFYNPKKQKLNTETDFKAYRGGNILTGNSLSYDLKNKKLDIEEVKVWLEKQ